MNEKIMEIAERIRGLRDIIGIPAEEMARVTGVSEKEYLEYESGSRDFSFTFLYNAAKRFGVDIVAVSYTHLDVYKRQNVHAGP